MSSSSAYAVDPDEFAKLVVEKWQTKILALGITDTRALLNSFTTSIARDASGDPKLISFVFNYYGKFLDMGVFGTGSRKLGTAQKHYRAVQPWYSSIFAQVRRLANLMARQYGYESVTTITESIKK